MSRIPITAPEKLEHLDIGLLRPYADNARTHTERQIDQIAASMEKFGFTNPLLVDTDNTIIAGHGRLEAARKLKMASVPVLRLEHLSEAERKAYVIADNRLAELAGWDEELLALELKALSDLDLSLDATVTGFDNAEIEALFAKLDEPVEAEETVREPDPAAARISSLGDVWVLGEHRLVCGDATDPDVYRALLEGEKAQMVFTDPPYNVPVNGHICGLGGVKHDEFVMASGEMSKAEFTGFLCDVTRNLVGFSIDGSIHYVCMDWRHMGELLKAGEAFTEFKNLVVWNKDNGGMGAFYRSKHELVFVFKNGTAPHVNNFGLGQHGRYRTNVWDYAGVNSLKAERNEELAMHPTVKPVAMVADAMRDCSTRKGIVLDPFSGSGTTIMAAEETERKARVIELDPAYVDVAIERWQKSTGKKAHLARSGSTFDEIRKLAEELEG